MSRQSVIVANVATTASEVFDRETVVINFEHGTYFSLRGSGGTIWSLLQAPTSIASIVDIVGAEAEAMEAKLMDFIGRLVEADLVIQAADAPARPLLSADAIASLAEPAILETYDDLAQLIAMDPVHEVDSLSGWPRARPPVGQKRT